MLLPIDIRGSSDTYQCFPAKISPQPFALISFWYPGKDHA